MRFGLLILLFLFQIAFAKQIDESTAAEVGQAFLKRNAPGLSKRGSLSLKLVRREMGQVQAKTLGKSAADAGASGRVAWRSVGIYYVFDVDNSGFIIVSGDDKATPILGYSESSAFGQTSLPPNAAKWLEGYKNQIRTAIEQDEAASAEDEKAWSDLVGTGPIAAKRAATAAVNPLLSTKWDQGQYYNAQCPVNTVTGCVATAMAQIMKYWGYPKTGTGFHSYSHSQYGTLSANFGSTTYQWTSMPNIVSSQSSAIATLMYHAGVSVDMDYGTAAAGGSAAYVISAASPTTNTAEYALKTYFGYKSSLKGVQQVNYTAAEWVSLLKAELDAGRPVLHAGFGTGGGHAFVCDGYDASSLFHFNWGWSGQYDGYFAINALNPGGVGTGGGTGGYNSSQQAVIGIEPPSTSLTYNIGLYSYLTPSSQNVGYGNAFSVSTNVVNNGPSTFSGDWCAAVFDNNGVFVDYVEIKSGMTLSAGYVYTNGLTFTNSGTFKMLPQNYTVSIYYRPTGGEWGAVSSVGSYVNSAQVHIVNSSNIELYSAIKPTPLPLVQGQSASFNLNVTNVGSTTFSGQYKVSLYALDGTWIQTIGTYNESSGLLPNYTYLSPYLTFSTSSIAASPGTYLLAVEHKAASGSSFVLTGSTNYQNPISITVQASGVSQDGYEPNNSLAQASDLSVAFSGNNSTVNTSGANCHLGTDNDYYKLTLPAGWLYTINTRLHDSYNSTNGNTYTLDALFSYSLDGVNWSDTFDDVMPGSIQINGGGVLYFRVAPYFSGRTGTYLLASSISRSPGVGLIHSPENQKSLRLYPLPAASFVNVELRGFESGIDLIELWDARGVRLYSRRFPDATVSAIIPLSTIPSGTYQIRIGTKNGEFKRELRVAK